VFGVLEVFPRRLQNTLGGYEVQDVDELYPGVTE
jgi:hypothetical protein